MFKCFNVQISPFLRQQTTPEVSKKCVAVAFRDMVYWAWLWLDDSWICEVFPVLTILWIYEKISQEGSIFYIG